MNLFKAKTADQLEEKLMKIVNDFSHTVGLKDEVTTKVKNAEGHIKLGTIGGLGIGVLGVLGGIASIPLVPAIATTAAIGGFTVAGFAQAGRNERALELDAERHMHKVAQDLNIDVKDLKSIQTMMEKKPSNITEMKEKFINETTARIKQKIS